MAEVVYSVKTNRKFIMQRRIVMGRMRENPRYNVISMRISDEERMELESLVSLTDKSVSDIMREAMLLFKARLDSLQFERSAA
jgi:hypothetical protein